jgi:type IV fimbrial biogenesis protein FimT
MDGCPPARCGRRAPPLPYGTTLIELLVALAVLGMIVSFAIPSFATASLNAAQTAQVNLFVQAIYLARSEAIKRNDVVSLCPTLDGASCTPSSDWKSGWLVFVNDDHDSPASRDGAEALLRAYAAWDTGHISSNRSTLSFRAFGQSGVTATVVFCDRRGSSRAKAVIISQTGRPRITTRSSSGGALACP